MTYRDRQEAGQKLAEQLSKYRGTPNTLILALPRGGVPVAAEVAKELQAALDVLIVRKIGVPRNEEFAMGAIASIAGHIEIVRNEYVIEQVNQQFWDGDAFDKVAELEKVELLRRQQAYRENSPDVEVQGRTVILVDDGLATGATMRAAIAAVKAEQPSQIVVAVPVGGREAVHEIGELVDNVVCAWIPEPFWAVGQAYESFTQITDEQVRKTLRSVR